MIQVYWDESGSHNSDNLVVAGYLAPSENWANFSEEWKKYLEISGIPYFRTKDFRNGRSRVFKHLSGNQKLVLIECLINTIRKHLPVGFISSINSSEYKDLTSQIHRTDWGSPYTACVLGCLDEIRDWLKQENRPDRVAFILDAGHRNAAQIAELLNWLKPWNFYHEKYRIDSISFADDRNIIPLQAADLLAHESFKSGMGKTKEWRRFMTPYLKKLLRSPSHPVHNHINCDREAILEKVKLIERNFRPGRKIRLIKISGS